MLYWETGSDTRVLFWFSDRNILCKILKITYTKMLQKKKIINQLQNYYFLAETLHNLFSLSK